MVCQMETLLFFILLKILRQFLIKKYTHADIEWRWRYITEELRKRGVCVYSNGADEAGPFLKAMTNVDCLSCRKKVTSQRNGHSP